MTNPPKNHWRVVAFALVGLALVGAGLSLAALSNPRRFPINPEYDRYIDLFAISGFASVLIGISLFLYAVRDTTKSMPSTLQTNANIGVGLGFALQLAGLILFEIAQVRFEIGLALILAGIPAFVWGGMHYAQGKGHSRSLGWLAVLGLVGLIVLILLPHQECESVANENT